MRWKMIRSVALITLLIVLVAAVNSLATDNVEWNILKTLQIEATPLDVAITPDGRRIFVLTERGQVEGSQPQRLSGGHR